MSRRRTQTAEEIAALLRGLPGETGWELFDLLMAEDVAAFQPRFDGGIEKLLSPGDAWRQLAQLMQKRILQRQLAEAWYRKHHQPKRRASDRTRKCGQEIARLKDSGKTWPQVIEALPREWPEMKEYISSRRSSEAYRVLYEWARQTRRRYLKTQKG